MTTKLSEETTARTFGIGQSSVGETRSERVQTKACNSQDGRHETVETNRTTANQRRSGLFFRTRKKESICFIRPNRIAMNSISAELDVIRLLEEEFENKKEVEKLNHRLKRLKKLAHTIDDAAHGKENDFDVYKATNILCRYLGILWRNTFNKND